MPQEVPNKRLAATQASDVPVEVNAIPVEPKRTDVEQARMSRLDEMREYFKHQKRVRVKVRNDGDVPVQINGYTFVVQSNVSVEVPQDVADLLENAGYI